MLSLSCQPCSGSAENDAEAANLNCCCGKWQFGWSCALGSGAELQEAKVSWKQYEGELRSANPVIYLVQLTAHQQQNSPTHYEAVPERPQQQNDSSLLLGHLQYMYEQRAKLQNLDIYSEPMKQKELHQEIHLDQLLRFVLNLQQKRLFTNELHISNEPSLDSNSINTLQNLVLSHSALSSYVVHE